MPALDHLGAEDLRRRDPALIHCTITGFGSEGPLAADPGFATNRWIYLYWSPAGDVPENRVSRFTLDGDRLDGASEKVVLRVPVQREVCCHEAGSLAFDGDGNLFVSTGDNTNPFESDGFNPTSNRWAISGYMVGNAVFDPLTAYDATAAARRVMQFMDDDVSKWYVRQSRARFYGKSATP